MAGQCVLDLFFCNLGVSESFGFHPLCRSAWHTYVSALSDTVDSAAPFTGTSTLSRCLALSRWGESSHAKRSLVFHHRDRHPESLIGKQQAPRPRHSLCGAFTCACSSIKAPFNPDVALLTQVHGLFCPVLPKAITSQPQNNPVLSSLHRPLTRCYSSRCIVPNHLVPTILW